MLCLQRPFGEVTQMLKKIRGAFVMLHECVKMSLANILGNRARSFLTVLGILIGVAAVIALITTASPARSPAPFPAWARAR